VSVRLLSGFWSFETITAAQIQYPTKQSASNVYFTSLAANLGDPISPTVSCNMNCILCTYDLPSDLVLRVSKPEELTVPHQLHTGNHKGEIWALVQR
jgi:hypothetical protein